MNWRFFLFGCHLDDVHSIKTCFFFSLYVRAYIISRFICLFFFSYKMILLFGSWSNFSMMLVSRYICSHSLCVRFFFFEKRRTEYGIKGPNVFVNGIFFINFSLEFRRLEKHSGKIAVIANVLKQWNTWYCMLWLFAIHHIDMPTNAHKTNSATNKHQSQTEKKHTIAILAHDQ